MWVTDWLNCSRKIFFLDDNLHSIQWRVVASNSVHVSSKTCITEWCRPDHGIRAIFPWGIWNRENNSLMESGIMGMAPGDSSRNPSSTTKVGVQYLESGIHCVESRVQDCLGFPKGLLHGTSDGFQATYRLIFRARKPVWYSWEFSWGSPLGYLNPDPVTGQKISFSTSVYRPGL